MTTTLVIDGNNLLMRSVKAMQYSGLASASGIATGPLLAFVNGLSKHVREEKPDRVVVCWDSRQSRWRNEVSDTYKGNRHDAPVDEFKESAFGLAKEFLALANIHQVEIPGAEADDLVAAYWRVWKDARERGDRLVILSSDKDFLQLLDRPGIEQVRLGSADTPTDRWDRGRVFHDLGYEPADAPLVMAIVGDVADNVIGIRGLGPKKAVKALQAAHWQIDELALDDEQKEVVRSNLALVDLRSRHAGIDVAEPPLFEPTSAAHPSLHELLVEFLSKYQMNSIISRLNMGELW